VKMPIWKAAFLVLLVAVPGFAISDEEPSMDDKAPADPLKHGDHPGPEATPEQLHKLHAKMDADANGKLSLDEIVHFSRETQFSRYAKETPDVIQELDGDKNGKLSLDEILKSYLGDGGQDGGHDTEDETMRKQEVEKFKAADRDSDGLLDQKEVTAFYNPDVHDVNVLLVMAQQHIESKDDDKDGLLTIDEFWKVLQGEERSEHDLQTFKQLDKDGSGKIDKKELLLLESGHLNRLQDSESFMKLADTDSDQHVTIEEMHAAHGKDDGKFHFIDWIQHNEL